MACGRGHARVSITSIANVYNLLVMSGKLRFKLEEDVAVITLDDGKANAMGFEMLDAIDDALERALAEAKAVLIVGRPGVLSGGFDLKVMTGDDKEEVRRLVRHGVRTLMRLYGHPQPLVVAATGHALALGALVLLAGDFRIGCNGDFKIGLNETAIGFDLPRFAIEMVQARLSPRHVTEAAINARMYSPEMAVEAGFLDALVDPDTIEAAAFDKVCAMTALDAAAFASTKSGFRAPLIERVLADSG